MTPFSAYTTQSDRNLDPIVCRNHAQDLRSQYLSLLATRIIRATRRALALPVRGAVARLQQV